MGAKNRIVYKVYWVSVYNGEGYFSGLFHVSVYEQSCWEKPA